MTTNLNKAKRAKQDEFYTQREDIENELRHYWPHFKDKVVYLNCDDPTVSNFWFYFQRQFAPLGLKKLIATCYQNRNPDLFSRHDDDKAICLEYSGTRNANGIPDVDELAVRALDGDGDFRSAECIELLTQADIVVTNPPFSLFREYVAQLMEYEKQFLIIGNMNAMSYKEIFPLIKNERMWLGVNNGGTKWFEVNPDYEIQTESRKKWVNGKKFFSMGNVGWWTNLDHKRRHEELILYRRYSPEEYPQYDNHDAIEVSRYDHIPCDYPGTMGVPVTFLDKHNPEQFEIVGMDTDVISGETGPEASRFYVNGKRKYARIVIRNRRPQT